jgi:branched-chain amino acid transport system ATP-binding protein
MKEVLNADGLETYYGKSHILHGVGLEVGEGEIVALLGRNGAGKTTTLRSLTGLTPPRRGSVRIFGHRTTAWPAHRIAQLGVGYVPEGRKIFASLTVHENLLVPRAQAGPWDLDRIFRLFPRLKERKGQLGRQLSGGEQEMLAIARPLLLNPRLMLLDEPSQGLAPIIVREVMEVVRSMRDEGLSVLLVEQNVPMSLKLADRAYILDDGRVVYRGRASELAADQDLVERLAGAHGEPSRKPGDTGEPGRLSALERHGA